MKNTLYHVRNNMVGHPPVKGSGLWTMHPGKNIARKVASLAARAPLPRIGGSGLHIQNLGVPYPRGVARRANIRMN